MASKNPKNDQQEPPSFDHRLSPRQESYLKASKEITIKYIETGRISVAAFDDTFRRIYNTIKETLETQG